jgi:uncharacterized membrane protein
MGQDNTSENDYRTGYGGYGRYTSPQQPGSASTTPGTSSGTGGQQYGQQGGYQQSSHDQQFQGQEYEYGSGSTYQPPGSAAMGASVHDPTSTGWSGRTEALVSYALWFVGGIFFFLIERKNRFVRFNAAQSIIFFGGVSIVLEVLHLISIIPILGFLLSIPLGLVSGIITIVAVLVWLFAMFQMYRGKNFRIPIVSGYAEALVDRFTSKKRRTT